VRRRTRHQTAAKGSGNEKKKNLGQKSVASLPEERKTVDQQSSADGRTTDEKGKAVTKKKMESSGRAAMILTGEDRENGNGLRRPWHLTSDLLGRARRKQTSIFERAVCTGARFAKENLKGEKRGGVSKIINSSSILINQASLSNGEINGYAEVSRKKLGEELSAKKGGIVFLQIHRRQQDNRQRPCWSKQRHGGNQPNPDSFYTGDKLVEKKTVVSQWHRGQRKGKEVKDGRGHRGRILQKRKLRK